MNQVRFKVGDKVSWCGVRGLITKDWKFGHPEAASLEVAFDVEADVGMMSKAHVTEKFMYDGKLHPWHKEPSLKMRDE